ncbi:MAG: glycosyltransferase [Novosphingobium sp.]
MAAADLTVLILTYNEACHIGRAIRSVKSLARRVVVVDSFSTDETVAIAEDEGAEVLQHTFVNQALQFQWGMDNAAITTSWVIRLDADDTIDTPLSK